MSDRFKALLVDMGNTRIKFSLVNNLEHLDVVKYCGKSEHLTQSIGLAELVLVSSVGQAAELSNLKDICQQLDTPCKVIETEAETFGIKAAYSNFQTLGVDRWMAILAARAITTLPVAVIDLGTANTCDVIVRDQHQGGWISPGYSIMRTSLLDNTQQVFGDETTPHSVDFGKSTPECVNYGCLAAQTGFVLMAQQLLEQEYSDYLILVTGGGQELLSLLPNPQIKFFSNLVLRGLFRFL